MAIRAAVTVVSTCVARISHYGFLHRQSDKVIVTPTGIMS